MRGYDRDEGVDYDAYEEDGYEDYEGSDQEEAGEEEYNVEKERKTSAESLEFLAYRDRKKAEIWKKEFGSAVSRSLEINKKRSNFGEFFGPSKPVIAQRVIQESKSLLENPHLALRSFNSHQGKKTSSTGAVAKNGVCQQLRKVENQKQARVERIKQTRDYDFLFSDEAELPAPLKQPVPQNVNTPRSEARSLQVPQKSKQLPGNNVRDVRGGREERKPIPVNGKTHSKSGPYRSSSTIKPTSTSMDPRGQLNRNSATDSRGQLNRNSSIDSRGQLNRNSATDSMGQLNRNGAIDSRGQLNRNSATGPIRPAVPKGLPSKIPPRNMEKKVLAPSLKTVLPSARKLPPPRMQPSVPKQQIEGKRALQEPKKNIVLQNRPVVSSKPQINKPTNQISLQRSLGSSRPKKKPARRLEDDEDEMAFAMLRSMTRSNRYAHRDYDDDDDDDDSNMEANFDDIMEEERRSAKIARKEDEEQLRLIEEEERREQARRLAKKRKLGARG